MIDCQTFDEMLAQTLEIQDLPESARQHLSSCARCSRIVSDLEYISDQVRYFANNEPVPDLWPAIRDQLRREGFIRESEDTAVQSPKLVRSAPLSRSSH